MTLSVHTLFVFKYTSYAPSYLLSRHLFQASAAKAKKRGKDLRGTELLILWQRKKQSEYDYLIIFLFKLNAQSVTVFCSSSCVHTVTLSILFHITFTSQHSALLQFLILILLLCAWTDR